MEIKVSIILSVFNGEKWIDECIKNTLRQSLNNYEFLIVNDGSTDSTGDKIIEHANKSNIIRYLPKQHTGLTDSLNYALKFASGKWIARIDVDDTSSPDRLLKQLDFVEKNKNIILLGSNFYVRNNQRISFKSNLPSENNKLIYRLKNMKGFFPHSSAFFSREKALKVGGYRKVFKKAQDHDLWIRLSEIGEISCFQEHLVEINEHSERISNSKSGWSQYIYAFTSITSHYLRINGEKILDNQINNNTDLFLQNVNHFLEKNNFYKLEDFKKKLKKIIKEKNKFLMIKNLIYLFKNKSKFFFWFIKLKLFGTNLPYNYYLSFLGNKFK